jgi:hypothetical protein
LFLGNVLLAVVFDGIGEKVFLVLVVCVDGTFDFTMLYQCAFCSQYP